MESGAQLMRVQLLLCAVALIEQLHALPHNGSRRSAVIGIPGTRHRRDEPNYKWSSRALLVAALPLWECPLYFRLMRVANEICSRSGQQSTKSDVEFCVPPTGFAHELSRNLIALIRSRDNIDSQRDLDNTVNLLTQLSARNVPTRMIVAIESASQMTRRTGEHTTMPRRAPPSSHHGDHTPIDGTP